MNIKKLFLCTISFLWKTWWLFTCFNHEILYISIRKANLFFSQNWDHPTRVHVFSNTKCQRLLKIDSSPVGPSSYKWSYNPYRWPSKRVAELIASISGVLGPYLQTVFWGPLFKNSRIAVHPQTNLSVAPGHVVRWRWREKEYLGGWYSSRLQICPRQTFWWKQSATDGT